MSCIVIIEKYYMRMMNKIETMNEDIRDKFNKIDICFIIRCILGIPYKNIDASEISIKKLIRNIMIGLINSSTLDMDKLDYIMRDAFYTGISVPNIDTKRLFKNMYISKNYELVYTNKAVSVLQTIIESRDNLYLYVLNHHTVVYTDFMYGYILRRLHSNKKKCDDMINNGSCVSPCPYSKAGMMERKEMFSEEVIINNLVSDSSLWHRFVSSERELRTIKNTPPCENANKRVLNLLRQFLERDFLKPWWKTIYEYKRFMDSRILDDKIRKELAKRICAKTKKGEGIDAYEFRSQIAKGIIALSNELKEKLLNISLNDGDFFIVERSNRFYALKSIENIYVYLKKNAIINHNLHTDEEGKCETEYFAQSLTNLLPQKKFEDYFNNDCFYVYIRPYEKKLTENKLAKENYELKERKFYEIIEKLFIELSSRLALMSESEFNKYCEEFDKYNTENKKKTEKLPEMLKEVKNKIEMQFSK